MRKFLFDPFAVQDVVGAEGYYAPIWSGIMHAAALQPLQIHIVEILEVHGSQKEGLVMKLPDGIARAATKDGQKHARDIQAAWRS